MIRAEKYRQTRKKRKAYLTRWALRKIRKGQYKNVEEARQDLGIALKEIGKDCGSFRQAYRIYGTDLLIKFPRGWDGKNHTRQEMRKWRRLHEIPCMRKHLPVVYYFNARDGVVVVKYYPETKVHLKESAFRYIVSELIRENYGIVLDDIFGDNTREVKSNLIFVDLGY